MKKLLTALAILCAVGACKEKDAVPMYVISGTDTILIKGNSIDLSRARSIEGHIDTITGAEYISFTNPSPTVGAIPPNSRYGNHIDVLRIIADEMYKDSLRMLTVGDSGTLQSVPIPKQIK